MADEQIKQNAFEYSLRNCCVYDDNGANDMDSIREAYLDGAHSRDWEIEELKKEIAILKIEKDSYANMATLIMREIDQLRNPWISVDDRLPENNCVVFVSLDGTEYLSAHYRAKSKRFVTVSKDKQTLIEVRKSCATYATCGDCIKEERLYSEGQREDITSLVTHWMPIPQVEKGDNMSKKNFIEACVAESNCTMAHSRNEVNLFCEIMEWSKEDVYFIGDDPHGVVSLGDYFFNMSDIHEVIANYEKHIERFGSNEELSNAIIRWYDWTTDWHNKHMPMEWVKVKRTNALTKQVEYVTPEVQEGKSVSESILFSIDGYGFQCGLYDKKSNKFVPYGRDYSLRPVEVKYWMEIREPDDSHNINLHSWLMGACDLVEKGEEK